MPGLITRRNRVPRWRRIAELDAFGRSARLEKFDEGDDQAALGDQRAEEPFQKIRLHCLDARLDGGDIRLGGEIGVEEGDVLFGEGLGLFLLEAWPPKAREAGRAGLLARTRRDTELGAEIKRLSEENFGVYGVRKVWRGVRSTGRALRWPVHGGAADGRVATSWRSSGSVPSSPSTQVSMCHRRPSS